MKRTALVTLLAATALAAQLPCAMSAVLRISDGTAAGTVVVEDNSPQDADPTVGSITYIGPVGTNWTVSMASGLTKPAHGDAFNPFIDVATFDNTAKGGTLTIEFTETNFISDGMLTAAMGGNGTAASVTMQVWVDPTDTLFGTNILTTTLGPLTGNGFNTSTNLPVVVSSPYSITLLSVIKSSPNGGSAGYDGEAYITPAPNRPSCPPDATIECTDSLSPTNPVLGMPTINEQPNCLPVNATYADTITMGTNCSVDHLFETIARTWTLSDSCNNTSTCLQMIYITDTNAPAFVQHPGNLPLGCNPSSIPTGDLSSVIAMDDCSTPTVTASYSDATNGCQYTRTVIYTATDSCGNSASVSQLITWTVDTNTPVFTTLPAGTDLGCNPTNIPTDSTIAGEVTATDDCSTPIVLVSHQPDSPLPNCGWMRTFTITAMDQCNNTTNTTVSYTWRIDTQPPMITCQPDMVVTNPNPSVAITGTPTVIDNCDSQPAVTYSDSSTPGNCAGSLVIKRTWTAVDSCGNSNSCTQTLTYYGNTADVSGRILLHCDATSSDITSDIGLSNVVVNLTDTSSNVLMTTETDVNGNYAFNNLAPGIYLVRVTAPTGYNQTLDYDIVLDNQTQITLAGCQDLANVNFGYADTAIPVIVGVQPGSDKGCNPPLLPTGTSVLMGVTASDDRGPVPVTISQMNVTNGCTVVSTFTITATGTCGNTARTNVIYAWTQDTMPPTVMVPPGGMVPGCNPSASSLPTVATVAALVTATDNCSVASTNISCVTVTNGCTVIRTFTVTATDHCGNTSAPQKVVYAWTQDTMLPVITRTPTGTSLGCNPKNLPTDTYVASCVSASDNCSVVSTNVSHMSTTNGCSVTMTFTITATDGCGNVSLPSTVIYTFNSDLVPPSITCPPAYTLTNAIVKPCTFTPGDYAGICNGTNPASILTNCFNKIYTNGYLQCGLSSGGYCARFTSAGCVQKFEPCGGAPNCLYGNYSNPSTCSAGSFGADVVCLKLNVDFGDCKSVTGFSGACGDLVYCDQTSPLNGKCVRQILSICNTALGGGNISSYGCKISDLDALCTNLNCSFRNCVPSSWCTNHLVPPAVTNVPPSVSGYPTVSDKCDSSPSVTYHDVVTSGACAGAFTILRTWTAVDACGNSNSCTQTISYGSSSGSICGTVFLDCNGDGYLSPGIDAGLSNAIVVLKSSGTAIATNHTDGEGNYCFYSLAPGTYTISVTPPGSYTETAATCTNHWQNSSGYDCWFDNDGYQHWKNASGTDCWIANDGCQHYKNSYGQDCWTDKYGVQHQQNCTYTSCNVPNPNGETVTLTACLAKTGVNFSFTGSSPKATVCVTGPPSAYCGQTITYTCCVTNTGTLCFNGGTVNVCGNNYNCPPLSPGQGCSFKCNYFVNYYDYPSLNCKATANCSPAYGNQQCSFQGTCNTKVSWGY